MADGMNYEVLSRIWHSGDARYYETGAVVRLDHLTPEEIDSLVIREVVKPVNAVSVSEETHGTDDSGNVI